MLITNKKMMYKYDSYVFENRIAGGEWTAKALPFSEEALIGN